MLYLKEVDKCLALVCLINESKMNKMAMSEVGNCAKNVKPLMGNKMKYQGVPQPKDPRLAWPWLTALILVVVNQYRVKTWKKSVQSDSDYVVEVKDWDGDIAALYESRGPGRVFAAGLVPKYGGCPKR